jgi:hypothetical protein
MDRGTSHLTINNPIINILINVHNINVHINLALNHPRLRICLISSGATSYRPHAVLLTETPQLLTSHICTSSESLLASSKVWSRGSPPRQSPVPAVSVHSQLEGGMDLDPRKVAGRAESGR